jgi:exosortase
MDGAARGPDQQKVLDIGAAWPLVLGFAVLALPAAMSLADQTWSHESGAHGPIILATGAWLLWRQAPEMQRDGSPGSPWITALLLGLSLASYVLGRMFDFATLQAGGVYGVGLAMLQSHLGVRAMLKHWFPLLYLGFAVPPPSALMDSLTAPLKHFASFAATQGLHSVGLPVAREGVTIFVAQYQLLVEDACSGMNSIVGLTAISLFYIYLMHGSSWRHSLILMLFVIPIAILANIVRICVLILLTYFFGDAVAQGFLHFTAGILLFATALGLVFAVDHLLMDVRQRLLKRT